MSMKTYRVTARCFRLSTGEIGLSAEQAEARSYGLKKTGTIYQVVKPIEFKRGEVIRIKDTSLPKVALSQLEPYDPKKKTSGKSGADKEPENSENKTAGLENQEDAPDDQPGDTIGAEDLFVEGDGK